MNRTTKYLMQTLVGLVLCCFAVRGYAQDARLQLGNLDKLSEKAAQVTDVTLDGTLLEFAARMIEKTDDGDPDVAQLKSIIGKLKGIYVKSFEFDEDSQYSKADVDAVRAQLTSPAWSKLVQSVDKRHNEVNEVYILKKGNQVAGLVVLVAEPRELTIVNIVGDVPVEKIAALEDHFVPDHKESRHEKQKKEGSHEEE